MPFTEEDKKELSTMISAGFKAGIQDEEFVKVIDKSIRKITPGILTSALDEKLKPVTDQVTGFTKKFEDLDAAEAARQDDDEKDKKKKGGNSEGDSEVAKQLKKMTADLAAEKTKREAAEAKSLETEQKRIKATIKAEGVKALVAGKVDPKVAETIFPSLSDSLSLDDDGGVIAKRIVDGTEETVSLGDYVSGYLKSDTGKHFVMTDAAGGTAAAKGKKADAGDGKATTLKDVLRAAIAPHV